MLLAGMLESPRELLGAVIAGSSLMEGEQVFLAVSCYQEAIAGRKDAEEFAKELDDVVDQLADTLIWRSSWDSRRSYQDRHKSVKALVALCSALPKSGRQRADIICHLLKLACDSIPEGGTRSEPRYDWSGIRQLAATGLVPVREAASDYIKDHRRKLIEPMSFLVQA